MRAIDTLDLDMLHRWSESSRELCMKLTFYFWF